MVGRFTRPVCLGPRTVCHCSAPSPWSSSHCLLTLLRERSSRLESPWPEVSQGHCILSDLLTERAGDCAKVAEDTVTLRDLDRKSTRLNSSHGYISYAVFCLKKKKKTKNVH